jgi:hypothetical protein
MYNQIFNGGVNCMNGPVGNYKAQACTAGEERGATLTFVFGVFICLRYFIRGFYLAIIRAAGPYG